MAESWFDHRAFFENEWGNRDIGLGQCSNRCRRELARMARRERLILTSPTRTTSTPGVQLAPPRCGSVSNSQGPTVTSISQFGRTTAVSKQRSAVMGQVSRKRHASEAAILHRHGEVADRCALRCWARELAATGTLESGARPANSGREPAP